MNRLIDILNRNKETIVRGNFLDAWNETKGLGEIIATGNQPPIEANKEKMIQLYDTIMDVASETPEELTRYDNIPVLCIHLLIGLECYIRADNPRTKDFLEHYIAHYFSAAGLEYIKNGRIKADDKTQRKLEETKIQEENHLDKYWSDNQLLNDAVNLIFDVFKDSYNRKAEPKAEWGERFNELRSIWFDSHIKAIFNDMDLFPIRLRIDCKKGLYFGFFNLLNKKTGYRSFDPKKGGLLT